MFRKNRCWILVFILFIVGGSGATVRAESLAGRISTGIEQEVGYLNYETILASHPAVGLSQAQEARVQGIFNRLVKISNRRKEIKYSLTVIEDPTVNAFSLPGGYVFVNTGLLDFTRNDDELAGTLAHEIGHIEQRHGIRSIFRTVGMSTIVMAAFYRSNIEQKALLERMARLSLGLVELGFSREAEYQADENGVRLMEQVGYNKERYLMFWKRYQTIEPGSGVLKVLSTHPPTAERIQRMESL